MNVTDNNSTTESSVSSAKADETAETTSGRGRWRIAVVLLMIAVAIAAAWKLTRPAPDLSSSINIDAASTDDPSTSNGQELEEASLLSRVDEETVEKAEHPFDPLLEVAKEALEQIDKTVTDYTAVIVSQIQLNGKLQPEQQMKCKIRHPRTTGDDQCGFSVYLRILKPDATAGQEVIWVDGWNDGNLVAHTTGWQNVMRFYLKPDSMLAMRNSRHSITNIGFRNLLAKMLDKGSRDREHGECEVTIKRNLEIAGRQCIMLEVMHPVEREYFDFHVARIYLDQELEIPIGYEGFLWPEEEGGEPPLLEKYFYTDLKLNVGLEESDFDPNNEAYEFPAE